MYIFQNNVLPIEFLLVSGFHKKSVKSSEPEINRSPPFITTVLYRLLASSNTLSPEINDNNIKKQ